MNWYLQVWKKFAQFGGRAQRAEYWYFVLFNLIISIALNIVDSLTGTFNAQYGVGLLGILYALAILVPSLAVCVRRLHDTGRSAWWVLIAIIPLIGAIVLLVFMCLDSEPGENRYGANPKGERPAD